MENITVGVAGLGFLGRGIAACLLSRGLTVVAYTPAQQEFAVAREIIAGAMDELIEHGVIPASVRDEWPSRFVEAASLAEFARCNWVIESVIEDFAAKQKVFDEIEAVVGPEVPIASNTSAIPISRLQEGRKHPERFLGMHWASPAYNTRFLEVIRGEKTSDAVVRETIAFGEAIGKEASIVNQDIPGFICNRIAYAMYREAIALLENGIADVETIDTAFRNSSGLWSSLCGPLRWMDISGGPALYATVMEGLIPTLDVKRELPETMARFKREDARGTINGRGFYQYTEEEGKAWADRYNRHVWKIQKALDEAFPMSPGGDSLSAG